MGKKILVVEDNDDVHALYRAVFRSVPQITEITMLHTAEETLAQIRLLKPDLVLIDISLPGMDGLELAKHLRKLSWYDMKILIITAYERDLQYKNAIDSGAHDLISKGDIDEFLFTIKKLLNI